MSEALQSVSWVATIGLIVATVGVCFAALTFIKTQKWLQLRFAAEAVEKIHSDETLRLAIQFIDWHDREITLPERYAHYGDGSRKFNHRVSNMTAAMNVDNRAYDQQTKVYDLKNEFRRPEYVIYVEIFDQFFDYLAQIYTFLKAGLLKNEHIPLIVYAVRRLDELGIFQGYLEKYELRDVSGLITRFRNPSYPWVKRNGA